MALSQHQPRRIAPKRGTGTLFDFPPEAVIAHGGNINGFDAYSLRLPDSRLCLALLMNHGNPEVGSGDLANQVAMLVLADGP